MPAFQKPKTLLGAVAAAAFITMTLAILICLPGCADISAGMSTSAESISPPPNLPPQRPNFISLAPEDWYIFYSAGMPSHPLPDSDGEGAWHFPFPTSGHVNYIQTPFNVTWRPQALSLTFRVASSAPQYEVIDPNDILPATVHVFFEQRNDNLVEANGRWWADASRYNLGSEDNTTITMIVPFDPSHWSNVEGQFGADAFYAALSNVGWIGMTCGGQYFLGHGVYLASGSASYNLIDFHVE